MKYKSEILEDKITFVCVGKFKQPNEFLTFKKTLLALLAQTPTLKTLHISFDSFVPDSNIFGLLLKLCNVDSYHILLSTTNYSLFRILEDLYLIEKLNVVYIKERQ